MAKNIQKDSPKVLGLDVSTKTIGWALFDRDPLDSFDFGSVTILGDAAHPLLPYGSQGATQVDAMTITIYGNILYIHHTIYHLPMAPRALHRWKL